MNRRGFFSTLAATAGILAIDPERALWTPGKKLISIPPVVRVPEWKQVYRIVSCSENDIAAIYRKHGHQAISANREIWERFIDPSISVLELKIENAEKARGRTAQFERLPMPTFLQEPPYVKTYVTGGGTLAPFRILSAYDIHLDRRLFRVDAKYKV